MCCFVGMRVDCCWSVGMRVDCRYSVYMRLELVLPCGYEGGVLLVRGYEGGLCRVLLIERRLGSCTTESRQVWELCFRAKGSLGILFPAQRKSGRLCFRAKCQSPLNASFQPNKPFLDNNLCKID